MARILMGFAEALPAAETFFSLRDAGHEVHVFARIGARTPLLKHLPVGTPVFIPAPEADTKAAKSAILTEMAGFDAVFALDDISLWLLNQALEGQDQSPVTIHVTGELSRIALNKIDQIDRARRAGLKVPQTIVANNAAEVRAAGILPAIVKPALAIQEDGAGGLKKGRARYFLNSAELAALPDTDNGLAFPALVQPLLAGTGEGVFGFAVDGEVVNWSGHERVRMMNPHGSGSSACRSRQPDKEVTTAVSEMIQTLGWRGPFMIELLRDAQGTPWFIELNGRMWGSLALARRSGFDYPAWAVQQALEPAYRPPLVTAPRKPMTLRHLGREILHLLFVLKGPESDFHKVGWPRLLTSLRGVLKPSRRRYFYNYDPAFPGYFLRDALATVLELLGRRR